VRYALHRIGDTRLSHDLEKAAVDPNPRVREDTAFVLGMLGEKSALKILRQMASDPDSGVRIQVAEARWRLGDQGGLDILVAGTISQFVDERMLCIMGLAAPKDRRVADHIRGQLTDDYVEVSLVAARCMGELGYDEGYTIATSAIRSPDPRQRLLAAMALGAIGRSDAQNTLAPLMNDSDAKVRLAAATALLQLKQPE
jgi:HEAT repeat protein